MKIVIFGLTLSSSWGNGHATTWRGLLRQLIARGHDVAFFERDMPYYAAHRDLRRLPGGALHMYNDWRDVLALARSELAGADVAIVTSYCPDAIAASELIWSSSALRVFYDLDAPVTLSRLRRGEAVPYIHRDGLSEFDLALSFTGGRALDALRNELGARRVAPLYGSVDLEVHRPTTSVADYRGSLCYLGTYSQDRQQALAELLIEPARRLPDERFVIAGAQYPQEFPWTPNIFFVQHLPPRNHPAFFCSSRLTLNVTRAAMREMGWCPSGRLFEAAACGVPVISDWWEGLDEFFTPGSQILIASHAQQVVDALALADAELQRIARAAQERTLAEHSAEQRAREFEEIIEKISTTAMAAA
jgi:spore maturation protein CgeB